MSAIEAGVEDQDHPDPLDLPVFAGAGQGRVRSSFRFGENPVGGETVIHGYAPPPSVAGVASLARARHHLQASPRQPEPSGEGVDWALVSQLRGEVASRLSDRMGDANWGGQRRQDEGRELIGVLLDERAADALARRAEADSVAQQEALAKAVFDAVFGLGRLQPLVDDDRIENILISGHDGVVVEHSDGTMWRVGAVAETDDELREFIAFLAERSPNPRSFTRGQPSLNLTLPDGSRMAAALDTARVSAVIRRHRIRRVSLEDLVEWGSLTETMADFLRAAVRAGLSIVVAGGQGAGKTTFLRALCACVDPSEVLGTFESEYELFLHEMPEQHHMVFAWEAREGSGERGSNGRSAGARTTAEQIISSFRFRLDRQIVGEILGPEVWSMIKVMESGPGSLSTTHAGNAQKAMRKLITCAMEAGPDMNEQGVAAKLADSIDLVVQLGCDVVKGPEGSEGRKIRYVSEILQITPGEAPRGYGINEVFRRTGRGQCGVADKRPDDLMADLVTSGFDLDRWEAERAAHRLTGPVGAS